MDADDATTVRRVARELVEESAPAELPLFEVTAESFFAEGGTRPRRGSPDDMLGFGVDVAQFLTPLLLSVTTYAVGLVKEAAKRRLSDGVDVVADRVEDAALARLQPQGHPATAPVTLDVDALKRIRAAVYDQAVNAGVEPGSADVLATSVVGKLATA